MEFFALIGFVACMVYVVPGFTALSGIICSSIFMRLFQMFNKGAQMSIQQSSNKFFAKTLVYALPVALTLMAHIFVIGFLLEASYFEYRDFSHAVMVNLLVEFLLWDFVVMPASFMAV
jgi:hypothetical protein